MPRYYFDTRDSEKFIPDEVGIILSSIEAARDEAARGLAEMARDVLPGKLRRELAVEVRDEEKRPVLRASLWFEVQTLA
jgi:hypothetical protein